ncbi:dephospho-CoA kinase [Dysgonamonadaceae bacterium]|jgi:dephospho-CoA kinase|nr:dephospho-CoA kinase [Dysgonamonadaceae bacterium]
MIKIGITGGIGSGKSVVSELLKLYDIPIYNADVEAKRLNDESPLIREKLTQNFGESLYASGKLDKQKFAQIIFNDPEKLRLANSIIHPELQKDFLRWVEIHSDSDIVAMEAALIFEANFQRMFDKVIMVYAPISLRVVRASQRDLTTPEKIEERLRHQFPDEEKVKLSDFVIFNDEKHSLIMQVSDLLNRIRTNR